MAPCERQKKTAAGNLAARAGLAHTVNGACRQTAIRMQEQQNIAFGGASADIHLPAASGGVRRDQGDAGRLPNNLTGSIIAAAINHEAFNIVIQIADAAQRLPDAFCFVQGRNNDAHQIS